MHDDNKVAEESNDSASMDDLFNYYSILAKVADVGQVLRRPLSNMHNNVVPNG